MKNTQFDKAVEEICSENPLIPKQAYHFLRESMDFTSEKCKENGADNNHVTAVELLNGFKDFSLTQFGPMAATVFREWNINHCQDIGTMVYALIDKGIFSKQDSDRKEDFMEVYSFQEAFISPFKVEKSA